jgi:hypothetical protein
MVGAMSSLRFVFEWQDPAGARGDELRATWASLSILIDGAPITELHDRHAKSLRTSVFLPMFPLAEWIVHNWWFLQSETERANDKSETGHSFDRRHNLRWAREGFALPSLRLVTLGEHVHAQWQPLDIPDAGIKFTGAGSAFLPRNAVEDSLRAFVDAVVTRLDEHNLFGTPLQEDWAAIQTADTEEQEFCNAAARLGVDPYAVEKKLEADILQAATTIRADILDDFFSLTDAAQLTKQATSLAMAVDSIAVDSDDVDALRKVRTRAPNLQTHHNPWETGYRYASELRARLNGGAWKSGSLEDLAERLDIELDRCLLTNNSDCGFIDALAGPNKRSNPKILIEKKRADARQFAFCRALFEHLTSPRDHYALVSRLQLERQQMNRAFAAEFLAPRELLKKELSGDLVGEDEINDLATDYGVSAFAIRHQIENHKLARVSI